MGAISQICHRRLHRTLGRAACLGRPVLHASGPRVSVGLLGHRRVALGHAPAWAASLLQTAFVLGHARPPGPRAMRLGHAPAWAGLVATGPFQFLIAFLI